jgi:hypothetical protein
MIWVIIRRLADSLTLVLLIIMIFIVMTNSKSAEDFGNFSLKLDQYKQDTLNVIGKNVDYMDRRINGYSETQDRYQVSTDQRVYVLEQRMLQIQSDKKDNQKMIQNNVQTLTNH